MFALCDVEKSCGAIMVPNDEQFSRLSNGCGVDLGAALHTYQVHIKNYEELLADSTNLLKNCR